MSAPKRKNYVIDAWLVILLALVFGGGLAAVQAALGPAIEANKLMETFAQMPLLINGASSDLAEAVVLTDADGKQRTVYRALDENGKTLGWIVSDTGQGFADKIETLIAVDANVETLMGIYVLDQKETPGLGDYIREPEFTGRFAGLSAENPIEVVKSDADPAANQALALTGATVSSVSVANIVNTALDALREPIREAQKARLQQKAD